MHDEFVCKSSRIHETEAMLSLATTRILTSAEMGELAGRFPRTDVCSRHTSGCHDDFLCQCSNDCRRVYIPRSVKYIASAAFKGRGDIDTIEFESGSKLTTIGRDAFACTNINNIVIPANTKEICRGAFRMCRNLRAVTFSRVCEVVCIGRDAFAGTNIENIVIPSSVREIYDGAFRFIPVETESHYTVKQMSSALTNAVFEIGSQLISIGRMAFACSKMKVINIPTGVKYVDPLAFAGCKIETFLVDNENVSFSSSGSLLLNFDGNNIACYGCPKYISIPKDVGLIHDEEFGSCMILEDVHFQADSLITSIGRFAFAKTVLKSVIIPANVREICEGAFMGNYELERVAFERNSRLACIGVSAFRATRIVDIVIPATVLEIRDDAFACGRMVGNNMSTLSNVMFERDSQLKTIGMGAFLFANLNEIFIPASVSHVHFLSFAGCHMEKFYVDDGSMTLCCYSSLLLSRDEKRILCYSGHDSVTIPSTVECIPEGTFEGADALRTVNFEAGSRLISVDKCAFVGSGIKMITFPASLEKICDYAFNCIQFYVYEEQSKLESVAFEKNSRLVSIGRYAFTGARIKSITIPANVSDIDVTSFVGCSIDEFCTEKGNTHFSSCNSLLLSADRKKIVCYGGSSHVSIPSSVESVGDHVFMRGCRLETVDFDIGSRVMSIGREAFCGTILKSFVVPASVRKIDDGAFKFVERRNRLNTMFVNDNKEKSSIAEVVFEPRCQLVSIGKDAFAGAKLKTVTIPSHVTNIDVSSFVGCDIESFSVESGNTSFDCCGSLLFSFDRITLMCYGGFRLVVIPNTVVCIPDRFFKHGSSLQAVEFEPCSRIISIGREAFSGTNIENLVLPASVSSIDGSAFGGCNILNLSFDVDNGCFTTKGSLVLSFDGSRIISCFGSDVMIPVGVDSICPRAFYRSSITDLTIPEAVVNVNEDSFDECYPDNLHFENVSLTGKYVGAKFQGIISHLARQCGENVVDCGVINLTAKSVAQEKWNDHYSPMNVIHPNMKWSEYQSCDSPGQWICIEFTTIRVRLTHYAVASGNFYIPRSWILEASNNGTEWIEIDRRQNDISSNLASGVAFKVPNSKDFRFIRFTQTGQNRDNTNILLLRGIEIFGTIV